VVIIVGIFGGSYPAFFLSRFSPVTVLKGVITQGSAGSLFRKVLVIIQFSVSVIMIICTLIVYKQLNYLKNMDQGFDQNNVIGLQLNGQMVRKYPVLKQVLAENQNIKYVTSTNTEVGQGSGKVIFKVETDQGMIDRGVNFAVVDHDFVDALGIKIIKGRDFQQDMPSDTLTGVVVNETFVKRMGWAEPIGKKVVLGNAINGGVIGVMKDYHQTGMYNAIESLMLLWRPFNNVIYIKLSGNETPQTLSFIESKWKEIFPDQPFVYTYLTDRFKGQFQADEKRGKIFTIFTILAILIACLGLFGLASYMVEQRTKEIGIRKVFGASEKTILGLISKDFLVLVAIGIIIAVPLSYYIMSSWLENYVYQTTIGVPLLILSAFLTILITFLTISYKAYQAAIMNPASALKTE
jgi:putative ABC transport system permease protein